MIEKVIYIAVTAVTREGRKDVLKFRTNIGVVIIQLMYWPSEYVDSTRQFSVFSDLFV